MPANTQAKDMSSLLPIPSTKRSSPKKKRIDIQVDTPPLVLTDDDIAACRASGLRVLQLHFPMLRSINRQYNVSSDKKRKIHTNPAYKREKNIAREYIESQVSAAGWKTDNQDFYVIVYDFAFANLVFQDIDGPRKATSDALQRQTIPKKEKEMLPTKELQEQWHALHPWAIWNDGQILQEVLVKHTNQTDLTCYVTIYAFSRDAYSPIPLHTLLHTYLLSHSS